MNITLTINAETPRELQETIKGLAGSYGFVSTTPEPEKLKANAHATKAADKQPEVKDEQPSVDVDKQPEVMDEQPSVDVDEQLEVKHEPETTLTMLELRAKASALSQAGKQIQVKGLLKKFKVDKLTELPVERFAEFWEALGGLE